VSIYKKGYMSLWAQRDAALLEIERLKSELAKYQPMSPAKFKLGEVVHTNTWTNEYQKIRALKTDLNDRIWLYRFGEDYWLTENSLRHLMDSEKGL
jgi:hypothetical protein